MRDFSFEDEITAKVLSLFLTELLLPAYEYFFCPSLTLLGYFVSCDRLMHLAAKKITFST